MDNKERKDEILEDYTKDVRAYMKTLKGIVTALCLVIVLFIVGIVAVQIHNQQMMRDMANHNSDKIAEIIAQYDWQVEYEIESTGNEYYSGNIMVEK